MLDVTLPAIVVVPVIVVLTLPETTVVPLGTVVTVPFTGTAD